MLKLFDGHKKVVHMASCLGEESEPNIVWLTLFPYFLWPVSNIFMTASMYMTVAISIDRYIGQKLVLFSISQNLRLWGLSQTETTIVCGYLT